MFTIYIHILEVAAMYLKGTTLAHMMDMGSCYDMKTVQKAVKQLVTEGMLTHVRERDGNRYFITEKALEYCAIVNKKRDNAEYERDALAMHEARQKEAQEAPKEAITGVSETTTVVNYPIDGKTSFPLYGNLTIAEVVETFESNAPVKVVSASLTDDIVTLTFEPIPHDDPDYDDLCQCGNDVCATGPYRLCEACLRDQ